MVFVASAGASYVLPYPARGVGVAYCGNVGGGGRRGAAAVEALLADFNVDPLSPRVGL
jgi:hypothetical protein